MSELNEILVKLADKVRRRGRKFSDASETAMQRYIPPEREEDVTLDQLEERMMDVNEFLSVNEIRLTPDESCRTDQIKGHYRDVVPITDENCSEVEVIFMRFQDQTSRVNITWVSASAEGSGIRGIRFDLYPPIEGEGVKKVAIRLCYSQAVYDRGRLSRARLDWLDPKESNSPPLPQGQMKALKGIIDKVEGALKVKFEQER